jgi:hypothetical protein
VCVAREEVGAGEKVLPVVPYLIYSHRGSLSEEEAKDIVEWAGGGNAFTKFLEAANKGLTTLNLAVKALASAEIVAEKIVKRLELVERAEPVAYVVDAINVLTALGERQAMVAEFFYVTDLDAIGLGDDPSEQSALAIPSLKFTDLLVNLNVAVPLQFGVAGAWWDMANTLREIAQPDHGPIFVQGKSLPHDKIDFSDWGVKLNVYEVSTFDESKGYCEPGYTNDPGTSVALRAGIQPALCFQMVLTYNGDFYKDYWFVSPYDAIGWSETQWNLMGVLRGSS